MEVDFTVFGYKLLPIWTKENNGCPSPILLFFWQSLLVAVCIIICSYYMMRYEAELKADKETVELSDRLERMEEARVPQAS